MAAARVPDDFLTLVVYHPPPDLPVGSRGGRPRAALRVTGFVLATGNRWTSVRPELGGSGRAAHCRLRAREEAGIWDRRHADLLRLLRRAGKLDTDPGVINGVYVRAVGSNAGDHTYEAIPVGR